MTITSFLKGQINQNSYAINCSPEDQEHLNIISNSLFNFNIINKYTIHPSETPIDTQSQFEYERNNLTQINNYNNDNNNNNNNNNNNDNDNDNNNKK